MAHKCLGFGQRTDLSAAIGLPTVPSGTDYCVISVEGGTIRWRDDGTDPTNDVGHPLAAFTTFPYHGPFSAIKFIEDSAADTPLINVSFYSY